MALIELFDPTSSPRVKELPLAKRRGPLTGKQIGFLCNGKANAELLLGEIQRLFHARLGGGLTTLWGYKGAAEPASAEILERLRACDAVVTAIAD
jgi:hypothetical protein